MLPDIDANDGSPLTAGDGFAHERIVLVGRAANLELAIRGFDEPRPAGTEASHAGGLEFCFEFIKRSKGGNDRGIEIAGRLAARIRCHDVPEKGVVPVTPTIVAHRCTDGLWHGGEISNEVVDRFGGQLRRAFESFVRICHVSVVMLAMMNFHCLRVNMRFERGEVVRE